MSKEIFIAFAAQKGGVGKTSVTVLVASYLHYVKGYNVAIVDCDYPQNSIVDMREREVRLIDENLSLKTLACDHFRQLKKKAYPVIASNPFEALDDAERMMKEEEVRPDIVFFDLPGTLKSKGVVSTLSQMDYIFAPVSADRLVLESTLQFTSMFNENLMTTGLAKAKGLYLFWTMVDGREKSELYEIYEQVIAQLGLSVLKTYLPDSKRFRRDLSAERKSVFRSTIFPMDNTLMKGSNIKELSEEICNLIRS
jgi:cellulose biosynthesis protein BcsQ